MTEAEIRERIWTYIVENFLYMRPNLRVDPDESLLRSGVFDSMGVMEVTEFLEQSFGITVDQTEVTEANFDTLNAIVRYVVVKRDGVRPADS